MGAISKAKIRAIKKRDGNEPVKVFKAGGRVKKFEEGGESRLKINAGGGRSKRKGLDLTSAGGSASYDIPLSENLSLTPYLEGFLAKGKYNTPGGAGDIDQGGITGGGVNLNYRFKKGGKTGLYANIHAKQARIAAGSKEKMRKPNSPGAPTDMAFKQSAKTAKKSKK
jgi:hypothetical protein